MYHGTEAAVISNKKLWFFSVKSRTGLRYPFISSTQHNTRDLAREIQQEIKLKIIFYYMHTYTCILTHTF